MSEYVLSREIMARSRAENWEEAKAEWHLRDVYFADDYETCLCGHYPIIECCMIQNQHSKEVVMVGNCCVKKFMGLGSDLIFQGIKRIKDDDTKAVNEALAQHAHQKGWISAWEHGFIMDTMKKRKLSSKQQAKRIEINHRLIEKMKKNPA